MLTARGWWFLTLATLILALSATMTHSLTRPAKVLAWVVFVGTLGQAPLGAITVYFHLNPWLVLTHLLLSLAVLGICVVVLIEATRTVRGSAEPLPSLARFGGALLLVSVSVLLVAGTIVTASGPHPGGQDVRRLSSFKPALDWHVRATAVFGVVFLALALWGWRNRARFPWLPRASAGLFGLLATADLGPRGARATAPLDGGRRRGRSGCGARAREAGRRQPLRRRSCRSRASPRAPATSSPRAAARRTRAPSTTAASPRT